MFLALNTLLQAKLITHENNFINLKKKKDFELNTEIQNLGFVIESLTHSLNINWHS